MRRNPACRHRATGYRAAARWHASKPRPRLQPLRQPQHLARPEADDECLAGPTRGRLRSGNEFSFQSKSLLGSALPNTTPPPWPEEERRDTPWRVAERIENGHIA